MGPLLATCILLLAALNGGEGLSYRDDIEFLQWSSMYVEDTRGLADIYVQQYLSCYSFPPHPFLTLISLCLKCGGFFYWNHWLLVTVCPHKHVKYYLSSCSYRTCAGWWKWLDGATFFWWWFAKMKQANAGRVARVGMPSKLFLIWFSMSGSSIKLCFRV